MDTGMDKDTEKAHHCQWSDIVGSFEDIELLKQLYPFMIVYSNVLRRWSDIIAPKCQILIKLPSDKFF